MTDKNRGLHKVPAYHSRVGREAMTAAAVRGAEREAYHSRVGREAMTAEPVRGAEP